MRVCVDTVIGPINRRFWTRFGLCKIIYLWRLQKVKGTNYDTSSSHAALLAQCPELVLPRPMALSWEMERVVSEELYGFEGWEVCIVVNKFTT